jgi:hypothetical protein
MNWPQRHKGTEKNEPDEKVEIANLVRSIVLYLVCSPRLCVSVANFET